MKQLLLLLSLVFLISCKETSSNASTEEATQTLNDSTVQEREYAVLDSKVLDAEALWKPFNFEVKTFTKTKYDQLKPFIFEKTIPEIQQAVAQGQLTYEELVLFYLSRIKKYDRNNDLSLNSVIALNPKVLDQARELDENRADDLDPYAIYGMPILLKDNINAADMPTTAGAVVFEDNDTGDAFITQKLKEHGALILGKANLSEWAYFFCGDCPSGYSAVGGQTLNPYGRKIHDTGGSSSGSGVAMAANFAVAAVGSETSGSILSPSSSNSVVGLKPTIGLLSRGGIIPISSTLDTPGPMTRSVIDNAILLQAMTGLDEDDAAAVNLKAASTDYVNGLKDVEASAYLSEKRLGYYTNYDDTLYLQAVEALRKAGATLIPIERPEVDLPQFTRVLNLDMQKDLPAYIANYGSKNLAVKDLKDITGFNKKDSLIRMPYGQKLLYGVLADSASTEEFTAIKDTLERNGRRFFDEPMKAQDLDAVLSINNYMAGYAAVAKYPAVTVPMGYQEDNRPMGLTFIAPTLSEAQLLELAYAYEQISNMRKTPADFEE
ncbi:MAG TPA: amidase [Leeuwenhoekiella sp.]|uniref:amidase family protein n=1 Tax=Leeuwenhoekiella palythoae TaxID=573501 RepID=UPI000C571100|nr:amidase family protein [Leeuwenhoekiella palythoae]MAS19878.1 amidase [Leeuwenhoekiella sp.]MBH12454.1 amidase [Leeuwenhoekiella sp.]UBZ09868.1 amidase [Leeuwenhoekiella palythoae]HBO30767.1 amidase [Leeuwenhoekiella sp.]HCQ76272.1 amidase [Leeuwenhoekiella sp.]|tara:strand:+ start:125 stop:1771 length:1647 start_codon:yes stop_codon:yes gene_type:complete